MILRVGITSNKFIVAQTFAKTVYPYYNFIKIRDENALLKTDYSKLVLEDSTSMMSILKYKKLWVESGEQNKEYIFQTLSYLCNVFEHYEEVAFSLKIINITTKPYELPITIT